MTAELLSLLTDAFKQDLKRWSPDDKGFKWLQGRCTKLLKEIEGQAPNALSDTLGRRSVVTAVWLAYEPASLPEDCDALLGHFFNHLTPSHLAQKIPEALLDALETLPEARRGALRASLAVALSETVAFQWGVDQRAWSEAMRQRDPELMEAIRDHALSRADEVKGSPSTYAPQRLLGAVLAMDPEREPPPELDRVMSRVLEQGYYYYNDMVEKILPWWPVARLETICLAQSSQKLLFLAEHCPTDAIFERVLKVLRGHRHKDSAAESAARTLVAFGPERAGALLEALAEDPDNAEVYLEALGQLEVPEAAPALATRLGSDNLRLRALALEGIVALGPEVAGALVERAAREGNDAARLSAERITQVWNPPVVTLTPEEAFAQARALLEGPGYDKTQADRLEKVMSNYRSAQQRLGSWLGDGIKLVVTLYDLHVRTSSMSYHSYRYALSRWWDESIKHNRRDDRALALALQGLVSGTVSGNEGVTRREQIEACEEVFGTERMAAFVVHLLTHQTPSMRAELHQWLADRGQMSEALMSAAFEDSSEVLQDMAALYFAERSPDGPRPELVALLSGSKASQRRGAAEYLRRLAHRDAVPAIEAALKKERSSAVRQVLEEARKVSDPILSAFAEDSLSFGAYDPGAPLVVSQGLEELRAILYEPATEASWVHCCDLIERFRGIGQQAMALDYVAGRAVEHWKPELRLRPWGWSGDAALEALTPVVSVPWAPVCLFMEDRAQDFIADRKKALEAGLRARLLDPAHAAIFADAVARAWRFAERESLDPSLMEIRVDGGGVHPGYAMRCEATAVELWHVFGVIITRPSARRVAPGEDDAPGLREARTKVPAKHPLRESQDMRRKRYLDLRPLIFEGWVGPTDAEE